MGEATRIKPAIKQFSLHYDGFGEWKVGLRAKEGTVMTQALGDSSGGMEYEVIVRDPDTNTVLAEGHLSIYQKD